jgi:SAM-dependent methyltransferase
MPSANRILRRFVPAIPRLSHNRLLMAPLDGADWLLRLPYRELRALPPNRFRMRVGVGNRLLGNAVHYRTFAMNFWLDAFGTGLVGPDSRILDIGCGCGRFAVALASFSYHGQGFTGRYTGIDVDGEMLAWCRRHFPADRFRFIEVDAANSAYRPDGAGERRGLRFDVESGSQDLVLANSLFKHLLPDIAAVYVAESARVLRPGGCLQLSALRIEDVRAASAAGVKNYRWTCSHRMGEAYVEDPRVPEAAVAYEDAFIRRLLAEAGFDAVETLPTRDHAIYRATRADRPLAPAHVIAARTVTPVG